MRSCLRLIGLNGILSLEPQAGAQNGIANNNRATAPVATPVAPSGPSGVNAVGVTISADSKLIPGDEVSILIEEDKEPAWKTYVTDAGEVELNVLGSVKVAGKTAAGAAAQIQEDLKNRYYHQATVRILILKKAAGAVPFHKVIADGKVDPAGRPPFTAVEPLSFSEAVTTAGTNVYSDLRRVKLTRGGQTTDHDVDAITKKGRTEIDVGLRDGDRIYVPAKGIVGFGN